MSGYSAASQVPSFRDMLRSLDAERTYLLYATLSQTSHGTHSSTWLYDRAALERRRSRENSHRRPMGLTPQYLSFRI